MKTITVKNLSTIKDHIVLGIIVDLIHAEDDPNFKSIFENERDHFLLNVAAEDDEFRNRVTYTVTDRTDDPA